MPAEPNWTEQLLRDRAAAKPRGPATGHVDSAHTIGCDGEQRHRHERASNGLFQKSIVNDWDADRWWPREQKCCGPRQFVPSQPGEHIERSECGHKANTGHESVSDSNACFWHSNEWKNHSWNGCYDIKQHPVDSKLTELYYYNSGRR